MELRDITYSEPSHIHVPRPSRSETPIDRAVISLDTDLQARLCESAEESCEA
jgi:hypothetical protein